MTYERCAKKRKRGYGTDLQRCLQVRQKVEVLENKEADFDNMCTKNDLETILKKISETYYAVYGEDIVKIVLYGSYARGDYQSNSDIDIVAIVRGERRDLQERLKKVWSISVELEIEYETVISPTVIPFEEYEKYKEDMPYYRNIQKEGVEVVAFLGKRLKIQ